MVKRIVMTLDDSKFKMIDRLKGSKTWQQFLIDERLKIEQSKRKTKKETKKETELTLR